MLGNKIRNKKATYYDHSYRYLSWKESMEIGKVEPIS
jgi:hypothetical protein